MGSTYCMFTRPDGKATWEPVDLNKAHDWLKGLDVTRMRPRAHPGVLQDGHPATAAVVISGSLEIGFEDGSKRVFGPGDARLVEDTTGKGHTTIALGNEPCITATIGLKDQG
jgi:hypothetical protein